MSANLEENSEVYNYLLKQRMPTEEDLRRVFTEEELKELCLKHKCKVEIWRWNVVDDYRTLFTLSGRYQKWSDRDRLRMLAKAVNKNKPDIYNEESIRKTREEEWKFQLKDNILSLNFWKRRRLNQPQTVLTESNDIDPEVRFEVNTESMNTAELLTASQRLELENTPATCIPDEEVQLQSAMNTELEKVKGRTPSKFGTVENNILEADIDEDEEYLSDEDSEDSLETVMLNDNPKEKSREILQSDEVAPEIENIYNNVNTMSMITDSEMSTQSQGLRILQSQDIIPANYDNFKNIIPLTSTQSQSQGTEE